MKRILFFAPLLLASCASLPIAAACNVAPLATASAQEAIAILERDWHLSHEKAVQWAAILATGAKGIAAFCAVASPPVALPGQ